MMMYEMGLPSRWVRAIKNTVEQHIALVRVTVCELPNGETIETGVVKASDGNGWYTTKVHASARGILVGCSCKAGDYETECKHVARHLLERSLVLAPVDRDPEPQPPVSRLSPEARAWGLAMLTGGRQGVAA